MSITCCRCHNHPLEKWTQDQYWSMANLFSRVALKNGDRAGEVIVQTQPIGDVPHPRRGFAMPPTPLDGKPMALDSTARPPGVLRRLADGRRQSVLRQGAGQSRLAQLPGPRPGRGGGRPARDQSAEQRGTVRCAGERLREHKYDVKHLMRTIMNSAAYQRLVEDRCRATRPTIASIRTT